MPLFKDLSYYNGSVEVWKYLESIKSEGDTYSWLQILLAGKAGVSEQHSRVVIDSRTE